MDSQPESYQPDTIHKRYEQRMGKEKGKFQPNPPAVARYICTDYVGEGTNANSN